LSSAPRISSCSVRAAPAKTHLAIAFGLIAAQKNWKVRFTTAADLVIAMEAAHRQGRKKEAMHRVIALTRAAPAMN
jgi:hypothetical protein